MAFHGCARRSQTRSASTVTTGAGPGPGGRSGPRTAPRAAAWSSVAWPGGPRSVA